MKKQCTCHPRGWIFLLGEILFGETGHTYDCELVIEKYNKMTNKPMNTQEIQECNCKEMSCKEGCTRNHTHKGFHCGICRPEIQEWEKVAELFHDTYETLAPAYGYETRADTKVFDPKSKNGKLMVAVCKFVISQKLKEQRCEIVLELEKCKEDENIWDYIYALKKQI